MRILLSCLQSLRSHRLPKYDLWRTYFVSGLVEAGHEVLEIPQVDWAEGVVYPPGPQQDAWRARTWEIVRAFVLSEHCAKRIDLFLGYFYPQQIEPAAIREVQRFGIPCVNFFCDNVREFRRPPLEYRDFALHWVPEFEALDMYQSAGLTHIHAPMPCWVPARLRTPDARETEPVTFIGSADVLRRDLLGRALEMGADFVIRGAGWTDEASSVQCASGTKRDLSRLAANQLALLHQHGATALLRKIERRVRPFRAHMIPAASIGTAPGDNDEYLRITRESVVTIGVNRVPTATASLYRPCAYSRLRDIEAPMLGACYLTEWTAGLEKMYQLGSEIEVYRTPEELVYKLAELRKSSARRRSMRADAQKRALDELSVKRSILRIAAALGLNPSS